MNVKEKISKINKRIGVLHRTVLILLIANAIIWFITLILQYSNTLLLFSIGFACITFFIIVVITGILIERYIKKELETFVEEYAGRVFDVDRMMAKVLVKKFKKHYIASQMAQQ